MLRKSVKPLKPLVTQLTVDEKLSALFIDSIRWALLSFSIYIDSMLGSFILNFLTFNALPEIVAYYVEYSGTVLGIVNIVVNVAAMAWVTAINFNEINWTIFQPPSNIRPLYTEEEKNVIENRHHLSDSICSLMQSSILANPTCSYRNTRRNYSLPCDYEYESDTNKLENIPIARINPHLRPSVVETHVDGQFVQPILDPSEIPLKDEDEYSLINCLRRYRNCYTPPYRVSTFKKEVEADDESLADLLDVSNYYATHPDEHPLTNKKKINLTRDDYFSTTLSRARRTRPSEESFRSFRKLCGAGNAHLPRPCRSPTSKTHKPLTIEMFDLFESYEFDNSALPLYEERLRVFIATNIVIPLVEAIHHINASFRKIDRLRYYSIGRTKLEDLEALCTSDLDESLENLPFVLRYLKVHPTTSYLLKRILSWAETRQLYDYNIFPKTEVDPKPFTTEVPFKEPVPTDSELLLRVFSTFMDFKLNMFPLTYQRKPDSPFSHVFLVESPNKPSSLQTSALCYYIELCQTTPKTFTFHAHHRSRWVSATTDNALDVLLAFIIHTEVYFKGIIHGTKLSTIGLSLKDLESY